MRPFVSVLGTVILAGSSLLPTCATLATSDLRALVPAQQPVSLRYVANAGVLLSIGDARMLIDAPIRAGIAPYATSDAGERNALERALPPYDVVDAILVTHWHEDHFSAGAVGAHLLHNRESVLVSSPEVVERVRAAAPSLSGERLRAVLPAPGSSELVRVGALEIRVLRIRHNPTRRLPEQHVGFLVGVAPAVLHTGDADPAADNFAVLRGLPAVDVALLPFWYLQGGANRTFVREAIAPRRIVAMHVPPADAADVRRALSTTDMRVEVLSRPGTRVNLEP